MRSIVFCCAALGTIAEPSHADSNVSLSTAIENGQTQKVVELINAGVDVNKVMGGGFTHLIRAADEGNVNIVKALLKAGADVNAAVDFFGYTPLLRAAIEGHAGVVSALIKAGADVNWPDEEGKTPLIQAVEAEHSNVVRILLAAGADPSQPENYGWTPVDRAAKQVRSPEFSNSRGIFYMLRRAGGRCNNACVSTNSLE